MGSSSKSGRKKNHPRESVADVAPRSPQPLARLQFALAAVALSGLVLISYGNSIANGFVWDDHEQIVMNPVLRADAPIRSLFTSDVRFANRSSSIHTEYYRPLQMLMYRTITGMVGTKPEAFHICSIVFAICGALAAFVVFWLLTRKMSLAFAAAAVFAVYPVHAEAVDWIAASPDLGCGLFTLLAFVLFLARRDTRQANNPLERASLSRWCLPVLSMFAFATALLWKETPAIFPILIAVYTLLLEAGAGGRVRAALKASAPYWIVLAVYLALRISVLGTLGTGRRNWELTPFQFLLTDLHLMTSYWEKLALPIRLNAYYHFSPVRSAFDPHAIMGIVFVSGLIAGVVYIARRAPLFAFAALWVCITLLPAMNLPALGRNAFTERYLYLPSVGFCLLGTLGVSWLVSMLPARSRKWAGVAVLAAVVFGCVAETVARNAVWKDDYTLFSETLQSSPDAPFVRCMVAAKQAADPASSSQAEDNYLQAIALAPHEVPPDRVDLVTAYDGVAWLYADRSDYQRALEMLSRAREVAPDDAEADSEEGLILARAGRWAEAQPFLLKSSASRPNNENVLSALGLMAWQYSHDLNRAAQMFSKALAVHSEEDDFAASLHNDLGGVYGELGDFSSAIEQFRLAIRISPNDPEYHTNLASALGATNRYEESRLEAETALRIAPNYPAALSVLQNLKAR